MSYAIFGDPSNNPILFFHGFGSSKNGLHPDTSILDKHNLYVISIDRPGIGNSSPNPGYHPAGFCQDVKFIVDSLQTKKLALAGWSVGGLYAQVFAVLFPEQVVSQTLLSSAIPLNHPDTKNILPETWKNMVFLNRYLPFLSKSYFRKLGRKLEKNAESVLEKSIELMVKSDQFIAIEPGIKKTLKTAAVEGFKNKGRAVYQDSYALTAKFSIELGKLKVKTHIWQGSADTIWTVTTSVYLKKLYPQSDYHLLWGEGHLLHLKFWENIVETICLDFKPHLK